MKVLALDLAKATGWAAWNGERRESGVVTFEIRRGESPGSRFIRFNAWLVDILGTTAPELVAYEQPFAMRSGAAAEISLGFATRVQEACAKRGIEHIAPNGSTIKKWTTGRGHAGKPEMIRAVIARFGAAHRLAAVVPLDDNQADAIALLEYVLAEELREVAP